MKDTTKLSQGFVGGNINQKKLLVTPHVIPSAAGRSFATGLCHPERSEGSPECASLFDRGYAR